METVFTPSFSAVMTTKYVPFAGADRDDFSITARRLLSIAHASLFEYSFLYTSLYPCVKMLKTTLSESVLTQSKTIVIAPFCVQDKGLGTEVTSVIFCSPEG